MADHLDHAWSALIHYGARIEEYDDEPPEMIEEDWDGQEVDEEVWQWIEEMEREVENDAWG